MSKIKELFINKLTPGQINKINYIFSFRFYNKFKKYKNKKKIIYTLVPTHGNMGDQAIAVATMKYLRENFKEYEIIQIYREQTYRYLKTLKKITNKDDLFILHGGGNMGNLYPIEEVDRRFIISKIKNNNIISMTQTMSFSEDNSGREELNKSKKIYNSNKKLSIIAREQRSYNLMKNAFKKNNIIINPDIVFYLNNTLNTNKCKREYIMTCLRNDKESVLGNKKDILINKLKNEFGQVVEYDTVVNKTIFKEQREKELNDMFDKFLRARIVITDRLHGMVFCAITKTPCIVTKSLDHKVTGTYEWIRDLNYIKLVDDLDFEKINPIITELMNLKKSNDINFKEKYFNKLTENLKEIIEK